MDPASPASPCAGKRLLSCLRLELWWWWSRTSSLPGRPSSLRSWLHHVGAAVHCSHTDHTWVPWSRTHCPNSEWQAAAPLQLHRDYSQAATTHRGLLPSTGLCPASAPSMNCSGRSSQQQFCPAHSTTYQWQPQSKVWINFSPTSPCC